MAKKIKFIIFDLGGVVVHGGYLDFLRDYCAPCLTRAGHKKILDLEREVNLGLITEGEFYREIGKIFGVHLKPKQMHEIIVRGMKRDRALLKFIRHLRGPKVAMFSNSIGHMATEVLRRRRIPARKLFKKVFVSTNMHMIKPDAAAYRFVLRKLHAKPRETLLVDDRRENVSGARKIGMKGIIYRNSRQFLRELKKYELR